MNGVYEFCMLVSADLEWKVRGNKRDNIKRYFLLECLPPSPPEASSSSSTAFAWKIDRERKNSA